MPEHTLTLYHGNRYVTVEVPPGVFRLPHADAELCFGCYWKTYVKLLFGLLRRKVWGGEYVDVGVVFCPGCAEEFERILASSNGGGATSS